MSFKTGTITVTTSATSILSVNTSQKSRVLKNTGTETVFIGSDNSVTDATGFPIEPSEELEIGDFNGTIYGIVTTTSATIDYVEDE